MSRTQRKILSHGKDYNDDLHMDVVDDSLAKHRKVWHGRTHKMTPYTKKKNYNMKEQPFDVYGYGSKRRVRARTGPGARLNRRNANRSFKKSFRQQLKHELQKQLEDEI